MDNKNIIKYLFGVVVIIAGLILNYFKIGMQDYVTFGSIGLWLVYIGFVTILVSVLQSIKGTKRKTDERMQYIGNKAGRITFMVFILTSFVIMVIDGINSINLPYHIFMANFVAWMVLVYFIAFKVIERKS